MDWVEELREGEKAQLWAKFTPATSRDIAVIEQSIRRPLPKDFRRFYHSIGYGAWPDPYGGGIYLPSHIIQAIGVPIYFALGSLMPGNEWASQDEHRELWLTQGDTNPDPTRFTRAALEFHGMSLPDLLEIGSDGSGGYQVLNLAETSPIKYLIMYDGTEMELGAGSFREGIRAITDWLLG
jgi:hypothetical protein